MQSKEVDRQASSSLAEKPSRTVAIGSLGLVLEIKVDSVSRSAMLLFLTMTCVWASLICAACRRTSTRLLGEGLSGGWDD
jgi:hypothetical protein